MSYNILIGGAAGQGMETLAAVLEKLLQREGYHIFTIRDYMSRVRGGHNFIQVRFGSEKLFSHTGELDIIIALNRETIELHINRLKDSSFVIMDEEIDWDGKQALRLPLKKTAGKAGNVRAFGSAAVGAVFKLYGLHTDNSDSVFSFIFNREDIAEQNRLAFIEGYKLVGKRFDVSPSQDDKRLLISGNEAIALGALAAGCRFYSAYPMTPSTSIMDYLASKMEKSNIVVEQAEDEIAAINMAIGASYAGARAMTGTSGGGFALMVEALGLSGMQEVPLVVAEIQRPGPVTGLPTRTEQSDLKFIISASQGEFPRMVIALRHPADAFYQTVRAFNLADKYQLPVVLLGDQFFADSTITVPPFDFNRVTIERCLDNESFTGDREYKRYELTETGISPRIIPGKIPGKTVLVDSDEHDEYGRITESAEVRKAMVEKRMRKLDYLSKELQEPEFIGAQPEVLLLAWGSLYGPVLEAVEMLNEDAPHKYGALVFGDIWPLPVGLLKEKAGAATRLVNVEQNATGQLAALIRECTGICCDGSILKYDGRPISSVEIYNRLKGGRNDE